MSFCLVVLFLKPFDFGFLFCGKFSSKRGGVPKKKNKTKTKINWPIFWWRGSASNRSFIVPELATLALLKYPRFFFFCPVIGLISGLLYIAFKRLFNVSFAKSIYQTGGIELTLDIEQLLQHLPNNWCSIWLAKCHAGS